MEKKESAGTYDYQSYKKNRDRGKRIIKRKKKGRGKIVFLLFFLLMFLLIPTLYNRYLADEITTSVLYTGKIEDSVKVQAFILRRETFLDSDFKGVVIPICQEGDRAGKNNVVARISGSDSEKYLDEITRLNKQIITAQLETGNDREAFGMEIERMDGEISDYVKEMAFMVNMNDYGGLKKVREEIEALMVKRAEIIFGDGNDDAYVRSLKQQKNEVEKNLNEITKKITAAVAGMVSYVIDGYEDYGEEDILAMDYGGFLQFVGNVRNIDRDDWEKSSIKIIGDDSWILVFAGDRRKLGNIKENDPISIYLNETGRTIKTRVYRISPDDSGNYLVFVKIDKYLNELSDRRKLDLNVIKSTRDGLMVPLDSLLNFNSVNGTASIALVKFNYVSIRQVNVLGHNEHHAIIDNLDKNRGVSLYDTYVVNPKNIYDGQVIGK